MRITAVLGSLMLGMIISVAGCSGGGGGGGRDTTETVAPDSGCTGSCGAAGVALSVAEVGQILSQATQEASIRAIQATIAVVDRVGNVLAVFDMTNTGPSPAVPAGTVTIASGLTPTRPYSNASLDGLVLNNHVGINFNATALASISKAITAAYLSTEGSAMTTRTLNQLIQENFNPGAANQPGGPFYGLQFSQLACSDITSILTQANVNGNIAPRAAPFGLAADPGGIPLYKNGVPVGAIGVISDASYGIDRNVADIDGSNDEAVALAGVAGFEAPQDRQANGVSLSGNALRYSDVTDDDLFSTPSMAPAFADGTLGSLVDAGLTSIARAFYAGGTILAGQAHGQAASGIQDAATATAFAGQAMLVAQDAFILSDGVGNNSFAPINSTDGNLTQAQVIQLLTSALEVANASSSATRLPAGTPLRAAITIVDSNGVILGITSTRDAPVFAFDDALQKARSAAFFSRASAGAQLAGGRFAQNSLAGTMQLASNTFTRRLNLVEGDATTQNHAAVAATALADGIAMSSRSLANLARPSFPDGVSGRLPGPLGVPMADWSPFATGLQLDLVYEEQQELLRGASAANLNLGQTAADTCRGFNGLVGLDNGVQFTPGAVPVYQGASLAGAIGVSGDGNAQNDLVAFLGLHNAGLALTGAIGNAPSGSRADTVAVQPLQPGGMPVGGTVNLDYVQCAPQNGADPCSGL